MAASVGARQRLFSVLRLLPQQVADESLCRRCNHARGTSNLNDLQMAGGDQLINFGSTELELALRVFNAVEKHAIHSNDVR